MDPRIEKTRTAVMDACRTLLVDQGPAALTMDNVVATSGVAKSTLYRHWATRDLLIADVFKMCVPSIDLPEEGGFDRRVRASVASIVTALNDESWRQMMPALIILEGQHPDLAALNRAMKADQVQFAERLFACGIEEGVLDPRVLEDLDGSLALLVGPLFMVAMTGHDVTPAFADAAVDQFLAAQAPRPADA